MLSTKSGAGLVSGAAPQSTNQEATMLINALLGFVYDGRDVKIGDQLEVPEKFGQQMIQLGRAVPASGKKKGKK